MLSTVTVLALALLSVAGLVLWRDQHLSVLSVQSASMAPLIQPGDAVVVRQVAPQQLKPGDVISYQSAAGDGLTVTHRIVEINPAGDIVTQGDNNPKADTPIDSSLIVGRAEQHFANAGYALDFLRTMPGLVTVVYIPALILVGIELHRLTQYFRPGYVHYSRLKFRASA